jgi:putative ABC transport system permease protein
MIKNYIKTAFRSLTKNKGFTAINVLGLALGLATCLLIVFYVFDELSYDRYNTNADRIFRVNEAIKFGGADNKYAVSPPPMAAAMKGDFPEIEQIARFRMRGGFQVKKGNQNIQENSMVYADPDVFKVFTLPVIDGNPVDGLKNPHSVVITERAAKKYFNSTDVVGKVLTFNDTALYKVTAVIKNIPKQSHFDFDFFISMSSLAESRDDSWFSSNFNTYILLRPGADHKALESKFVQFFKTHAGPQLQSILHLTFEKFEQGGNYFRFTLTPLPDIHLQSSMVGEMGANGNIEYVYMFSAIAVFILLIACVNFMNLSTARSANRAREVGVRKVLGSPRKYLIFQFLAESIMVTLAGAIIAVIAAWLLLPVFNNMADKELTVTPQILAWLVPALLLIIVVIGMLAGSYPAFFLSGFQPIQVLKGKLSAGFKGGNLRSFLVVFQFAISIFLIIGTLVIYNQLKFIQNKDLGYNRNHVLTIWDVYTLGDKASSFKAEIKQISGVENATLTGALPTTNYGNSSTVFKSAVVDQKNGLLTQEWYADEDYVPTLGLKIIAGRNFSRQMATDTDAVLINESAAKMLGYTNPIGQLIYDPTDNKVTKLKPYRIIGVMKDFNFQSLRSNVTPLLLFNGHDLGGLSIRANTANIAALLSQLKSKWTEFSPNQTLNYSFMDQDFDKLYRSEQRIGGIAIAFTSLAIIIACLGLFGLAAYAAEQRTKEIGIRKVLGASMSTIVGMLSKDFIKLVLISIVIASPFAWYFMNRWFLQSFAYRQDIQWWVVAVAGVAAIIIAFITISFQSIKAALTNPVKSLRSE